MSFRFSTHREGRLGIRLEKRKKWAVRGKNWMLVRVSRSLRKSAGQTRPNIASSSSFSRTSHAKSKNKYWGTELTALEKEQSKRRKAGAKKRRFLVPRLYAHKVQYYAVFFGTNLEICWWDISFCVCVSYAAFQDVKSTQHQSYMIHTRILMHKYMVLWVCVWLITTSES